jgi:hypothetical protein
MLLLIFFIYLKRKGTDVTVVRSSVDNKKYIVQNKRDKHEAADLLANIKIQLVNLVDGLKQKHASDDRVERLATKFNPDKISEGTRDNNYTSYTLNKGEKIVFCLRTRDESDRLHSLNLLLFVAIHELAHIMSKSQGHTPEFQENFAFILKEAVDLGIYKPENFRANPTTYCGIAVTDTPLGDDHFQ